MNATSALSSASAQPRPMPDIASQAPSHSTPLSWVGMENIALPLQLAGQSLSAQADIGVDLITAQARGIHMSRLYLALQELPQQTLDVPSLRQLLQRCISSQDGLAQQALVNLRGELLLKRPALLSDLHGYKIYPVQIRARQQPWGFQVELGVTITYSSTCPCSAALARQLIQQRFSADFTGEDLPHQQVLDWLGTSAGIVATPHSQRSFASLSVRLNEDTCELPLLALIERAEASLGTAVQTAVKRADEQAFALANGQNLMFCEDAARRLHQALLQMPGHAAFKLKVVHAESLHAHDAVARSRHNWS
ncbi:GTP cyclohydrolase FolE2 [Pseudomonas sp. 5P_3.1_Bac2]|uniref:GTP cyclohydrolase FolE2 n=1 Tax=Pseudomonas sp. 5P_3.1_Bac2 TaxID=2971617 RepID=UPI0021C57AF2|nr:GTP cyclohydrolase FolE2 [Pseudomonas sp. 5P_3.1_Bac2]MCU1719180.1 GTP cyclohydrolase FolE2 [Pseudomonas sp. 5P_3.1_Bac2]